MPMRKAFAVWEGSFPKGAGIMKLGSGAFEGAYSFGSRFESAPGTNPEELLGAAHAGCFSMALAHNLSKAGFAPKRIQTTAKVSLAKTGEAFKITSIELDTEGDVPGISEENFSKHAENAKSNCPVSQVLSGVKIDLLAKLMKG
jgi:osmotically inducible protein OsmC